MGKEWHLFKRRARGRTKVWQAYYYDAAGKKHTRSTGEVRQDQAGLEVAKWIAAEEAAAAEAARERQAERSTLRTLAADFFLPGRCPWLAWRAANGGLKTHTAYEHRKNLTTYLLPAWGRWDPAEIRERLVERWLRTLRRRLKGADGATAWGRPLSGSTRNSILNTLNIVLTELRRDRHLDRLPKFRRSARHRLRRDILTAGECVRLFPDDPAELAAVWSTPGRWGMGEDPWGLMFGLLFRLILHAGLRPGEGRAMKREYLYPEVCGVHVARQIDSDDAEALLKKATQDDPRERLAIVPVRTMELLLEWCRREEIAEGYLFRFDGRPVEKEMLEDRWRVGLAGAGIRVGERILQPYSLRYTWRNRAQGVLSTQVIQDVMGHRSEEVTEGYRRVNPEQFEALRAFQERIEGMFKGE